MTIHMQGRCVCKKLQYSLDLDSPEAARTTLCHCHSCRRAFGTNYGLTAKVPLAAFRYDTGTPKRHTQDNGVTREFCGECGAYICEYGVCCPCFLRLFLFCLFLMTEFELEDKSERGE